MKITGCRVNYGAGTKKELFELLPRSIERMITSNSGQNFDFKIELPIGGRVTSAIKSFGPDFQGQSDFEILKGQVLPVVGNRRIVSFGLKFNEDGTIEIVSAEEIPSNEGALPRESTVKQLEKIRKATKSTTIDDSTPKLKGANLGYERNVVDKGIESYEDFQKKNKSFIPGWNLKHLKSPFKKNEAFLDFLKPKSNGIHSTHYWSNYEKNELESLGFKYVNTEKTNSTPMGYFQWENYFLIKIALGRQPGYEDHKYQLISNDRVQKEFNSIQEISNWMDKRK